MIAPVSAVLAGAMMLWLAIVSYDGLVSDDYYKRGLAINQVLRRDERAAELGYRAQASLSADGTRVQVRLVSSERMTPPETLLLRLTHPTRAGHDQIAILEPRSLGVYEAHLDALNEGRWRVSIGDSAGTWRLAGTWYLPQQRAIELEPPLAK